MKCQLITIIICLSSEEKIIVINGLPNQINNNNIKDNEIAEINLCLNSRTLTIEIML